MTQEMNQNQKPEQKPMLAQARTIGEYEGWLWVQEGDEIVYQRLVTLTGTRFEVELPFFHSIKLTRTDFFFSTLNLKTVAAFMHHYISFPAHYAGLYTLTTRERALSVVFTKPSFTFIKPHKLVLVFSDFVSGETVNISISATIRLTEY